MAEPKAPTTRPYDLKSLVIKSDKDHYKPDDTYQFSNGRKFKGKRDPYERTD